MNSFEVQLGLSTALQALEVWRETLVDMREDEEVRCVDLAKRVVLEKLKEARDLDSDQRQVMKVGP